MGGLKKGGTMSRGTVGGKSMTKRNVDALDWLASVKVSETRRGSSSGGDGSRQGSASRGDSGVGEQDVSLTIGTRQRSESTEDKKEGESSHSLQDEYVVIGLV